jgi:hypothetical protein
MDIQWKDDLANPWRDGVATPEAVRPPLFPDREPPRRAYSFQMDYLNRNYTADPHPDYDLAKELLKRYIDDPPKTTPPGRPYPVGTLIALRLVGKDVLAVSQWHDQYGKDGKKVDPPVRAWQFMVPKVGPRTGKHAPEVLRYPWPSGAAAFTVSGIWFNGVQTVLSPSHGPAFQGKPWRGVLHTTEGTSVDGAIASYRDKHNDFPHLTIDPNSQRVVQHLPLDIGARALGSTKADLGTLKTNGANAIQIEIVGKATDSPKLTSEQLTFILDIMFKVEDAVPIPHSSDLKFLKHKDPGIAKNRLDLAKWDAFSGWCGHQHVPFNDHDDPGAIDIDSLIK